MKRRKISEMLVVFVFLQFYFVRCNEFNKVYYERCTQEETSCSSQIPGAKEDECLIKAISRTSSYDECRERVLSEFLKSGNIDSKMNDDLFEVNLTYGSEPNNLQNINPIVNISLDFGKNTKGFVVWLGVQPYDPNLSYCRGIFINKVVEKYPLNLNYDCFFFNREEMGFQIKINIMNFPNQNIKSFLSKVVDYEPFYNKIDDKSKWEIPIFIELTCLKSRNDICIQFPEVPPHMGMYNYTVTLRNNLTNDNKISHRERGGLLKGSHMVIFKNLKNKVTYIPEVTIEHPECLKPNRTCKHILGQSFMLPASDETLAQPGILHFILVASFSVIFVIFLVFCLFAQRNPNDEETRKVLVLYSCDNKYYMELVQEFVKLLLCNNFTVLFDRNANIQNPCEWLKTHILNDETRIIIIWSKGAVYKVQQDAVIEFKGEPANFTSHLFNYSLKLIQSKTVKSDWHPRNYSNVINIVWDKSLISEVPLKQLPMYILPKRWHSLLYHLRYIRSPHLQCSSSCSRFHMLLHESLKTYPQGKLFLESHKKMLQEGNYFEVDYPNNSASSISGNVMESLDYPGSSGYYSMNAESIMPSDLDQNCKGERNSSMEFPSNNEHRVLIQPHPSSEDIDSSSSDEEDKTWIRDMLESNRTPRTASTHCPHRVENANHDVSQTTNTLSSRETHCSRSNSINSSSSSSSSSISSSSEQPPYLPYSAMFGYPSIGAQITPEMHFDSNHFGSAPTNTHSP